MSVSTTDHEAFAPGVVFGPENRAHDRYLATKVAIDIDRQRCRVLDVSNGGLRLKAPPEARELGAEVRGVLVCRAAGSDIRVTVRGHVVRVEADGETVGLEFAAMPGNHRDAVAAVITMLQRLEIEGAVRLAQEPKASPVILRAAVAAAVFSATFAMAALYVWIR